MTRRGNAIYYVNYELQERECSICKEIKPFEEFQPTRSKTPKSWCRLCHARKLNEHYQNRKLREDPEHYSPCPDCGFIYHNKYVQCPKCFAQENFNKIAPSGKLQCPYCLKLRTVDDYPAMAFVTNIIACWGCRGKLGKRGHGTIKLDFYGKDLAPVKTEKRECLNHERCGNSFESKSKFNRICPECKDTKAYTAYSLMCEIPELVYV